MRSVAGLLAAGVLLVMIGVACGGDAQRGPDATGDGPAAGAAPDVAGSSSAAVAQEARIVVTSKLSLEVKELRPAYQEAGVIARSFGGYVADASIDDDGGRKTAGLRLRVPSVRHDEALDRLRVLGGARVTAEQTNAREVTEQYTDLGSRLRNLQRSEAQYQELLTQARTTDEIVNLLSRVQSARDKVERTQGRLNLLANQTDLATVNLSLSQPAPASKLVSPLEVFAVAFGVSLVIAQVALDLLAVTLVAAIWLVPASAASLVAWKLAKRPMATAKRWLS